MVTRTHVLIGIVALLAVIAGVFVGIYLHRENISLRPAVTEEKPAPVAAKIEQNSNLYDISPPSRGAFSETISIDLHSVSDSGAKASLPTNMAKNIVAGQNVVLYRADGMLLEIIGEVASIEHADNQSVILITIRADDAHPATQAARGDIIVATNKDSQRLPLSSLSIDKDGNRILWEVLKNADGSQSAKAQKANIISRTYDFIVIDQPDFVSNVYVLNPDEILADGQVIKTRTMLYSAPAETAEMKVLRAIDKRTPRIAGDPYKGPIPDSPCGIAAAAPNNDGSSASPACGQSTDVLNDFIQSIRQNTPTSATQP